MSPELEHLIDLQNLETAIEESRRRIAAHPQRLSDADARLAHAKEGVEAAKQRLKASQEARREAEKEAAVYQSRLSKFKDQLSAVKTNKEYQAMQHEIETAQKELGSVEEKVIERMVEADALTAEVKKAEQALAAQQKDVETEKKTLTEELATVEAALKAATDKRAGLVKSLPPQLLALFEQVARARKGIAIALATRDGLCSACHVRLRPQVFQEVRRNDQIIQCASCNRILYYVPPPAAPEPAVTHA
ncbi:MAG TPA: C4-type zinc ribbon domain-containing protein [Vicinamibacterales bacterium]|nr:C4-type zinc ribbon domain-containing protein [Vicinamibacterales bacterium]